MVNDEVNLISAMLSNTKVIADLINQKLEPKHFTGSYDKLAYIAILEVLKSGKQVNYTSVLDQSIDINSKRKRVVDDRLDPVEIERFLKDCVQKNERRRPQNAAMILMRDWDHREIIGSAQKIIQAANEGKIEPRSIANQAVNRFNNIFDSDSLLENSTLEPAIEEAIDIYENGYKGSFIKTGLKSLDEIIIGWQAGELTAVIAATGQGKSSFIINACQLMIDQNVESSLFSLEMSKLQVFHRLISNKAKINSHKLIQGGKYLTAEEFKTASIISRNYHESPFTVFEMSNITLQTLINLISTRAKQGCRVFFIDQLEQIRNKGRSRLEELEEISETLKGLAKSLKVAIILVHQVNKKAQKLAIETKGQTMPNIADGKHFSLEHACSVILILHRKEKYMHPDSITELERKKMTIRVGKNRYGRDGDTDVFFYPEFSWLGDGDEND